MNKPRTIPKRVWLGLRRLEFALCVLLLRGGGGAVCDRWEIAALNLLRQPASPAKTPHLHIIYACRCIRTYSCCCCCCCMVP